MARTTLQLLLLFTVSCSVGFAYYDSWQEVDDLLEKRAEGDSCVHEGTTYPDGASFKVDCNTCTCMDGAAACTQMACSQPLSSCTCARGGKSYPCGKRFMPNLNTTCICLHNDQVGCHTMPNPIPGLCYFNGRFFLKKQRFRPGAGRGACNRCACVGGNLVVCSQIDCSVPRPKNPGCTYKGKTYKKGDRFLDGCNRCDCVSNFLACTQLTCLAPDVSPALRQVEWERVGA